MVSIGTWRDALNDVIEAGLAAVSDGRPHDANPWIELEEVLGSSEVKRLWRDPELGPVAKAMDHYCEAAQHDRQMVFGDISLTEVDVLLRRALVQLKTGKPIHTGDFARFA